MGRGATLGVLVRNAEALETLAKVDTLVIDKTGTLTEGRPTVVGYQLVSNGKFNYDEVLRLAASIENLSEHPLARAITSYATEKQVEKLDVTGFHASAGGGVEGVIRGNRVVVGSAAFIREKGIPIDEEGISTSYPQPPGSTTVYIAVDGTLAAVFSLADKIKPQSIEAVAWLKKNGIRVVMLTGDRRAAAESIAKEAGITEVRAELLPAEKARVVEKLRSEGRIVAMAGDGINDAPALAAAHVGIAMGTGSDVAIANAGITLVKGDLRGILRARQLSLATVRNIKQNLAFAFLYNILGIPIAAGVFFSLFHWLLSPMLASAAMSFSSVSVITNALRLRKTRL
jgi:P-type Cu+ transporter